jgi:Protein of unknown function (DUF1573)
MWFQQELLHQLRKEETKFCSKQNNASFRNERGFFIGETIAARKENASLILIDHGVIFAVKNQTQNPMYKFTILILALFCFGFRTEVVQTDPNAPVMTFEETTYDFGEGKQSVGVRHDFVFTNTGKSPLIISNATTTCGCDMAEFPKEPILPGKSGVIKYLLDTKSRMGAMNKTISITSNASEKSIVLYVKGVITLEGPADAPVLSFDSTAYNFGTVKTGTLVSHTYHFTNTGKIVLVLEPITVSTGSGIAEWSNNPVAPGEKGYIKLTYDLAGKMNQYDWTVVVRSNNKNGDVLLRLYGKIVAN